MEGQQSRSFCYVDDLVDGIVRVSRAASLDGPVNLGNPKEFTIRELATRVLDLTGSRSPLVPCPLPSDDPKVRRPDITRAREWLAWEPTVQLREGLQSTIEDFRSRLPSPTSQRSDRDRRTGGSG